MVSSIHSPIIPWESQNDLADNSEFVGRRSHGCACLFLLKG